MLFAGVLETKANGIQFVTVGSVFFVCLFLTILWFSVWRQGLTVVLASLQLTLFVDQVTLGFTEILLLLP